MSVFFIIRVGISMHLALLFQSVPSDEKIVNTRINNHHSIIRDIYCRSDGILLQTKLSLLDIASMKFAPLISV